MVGLECYPCCRLQSSSLDSFKLFFAPAHWKQVTNPLIFVVVVVVAVVVFVVLLMVLLYQ